MLVTVGMGENGVFEVLFLLEKCVTPETSSGLLPIGWGMFFNFIKARSSLAIGLRAN